MTRTRPYRLAGLLAALCLCAGAAVAESAALEMNLRDTDRGLKAVARYFPQARVGGTEEITNPDGSTSVVSWDGVASMFETEITSGQPPVGADARAFLLEVIAVVCPSADMASFGSKTEVLRQGQILQIYGKCPAIDKKLGY